MVCGPRVNMGGLLSSEFGVSRSHRLKASGGDRKVDGVFCQNTRFTPLTGRSPVQALGVEGLIFQPADS
jgi:hypothetical protein